MAEDQASSGVLPFYQGWEAFQELLIKMLEPLTAEQLELRAAPDLRSIEESVTHIIGARARWFYLLMEIGGEPFAEFGQWDRSNMPVRTSAELADGLHATWRVMEECLAQWTPEDLQYAYPNTDREPGEPEFFTRQWVIWHLIEHDLHHGGEISLTLGMHGLKGLDL